MCVRTVFSLQAVLLVDSDMATVILCMGLGFAM